MRSWLNRIAVMVALMLLAGYAVVSLRSRNGYEALAGRRTQIRTMQEENANLMRGNQLKRARIERLRSDQAEQENEIRRRLKLLKPGEKTFILPEQK